MPSATWRVLAKGHEARNLSEHVELDERLAEDLIDPARAVPVALRDIDRRD